MEPTAEALSARQCPPFRAAPGLRPAADGPPRPIDKVLPRRSHLTAFLSDDDGQTWTGGLVLDERSMISYPDGFQDPDGVITIVYDNNRYGQAEILMARFREEDVLAGKFQSADAKQRMLISKATGPKSKP